MSLTSSLNALSAPLWVEMTRTPAPHRERERGLQQSLQVVVKSRLVDHRAPLLAAQIGGPRGERDDFVPGGEADAIGEDVAPLIVHRDLFDRVRCLVELARPRGRGLDELERHVPVVAEVPGVHPGRGRGRERASAASAQVIPTRRDFSRHLDRARRRRSIGPGRAGARRARRYESRWMVWFRRRCRRIYPRSCFRSRRRGCAPSAPARARRRRPYALG